MQFMYSIRSNTQGLIGVSHAQKHYVVGFKRVSMANKVNRLIHQAPKLYLERSKIIDVSRDVYGNLAAMGIQTEIPSILVDTAAKLTVLKDTNDVVRDTEVHRLATEEMFMYPFERNLGVIMEYDMYSEDSEKIVFLCNVIDPCGIILGFKDQT